MAKKITDESNIVWDDEPQQSINEQDIVWDDEKKNSISSSKSVDGISASTASPSGYAPQSTSSSTPFKDVPAYDPVKEIKANNIKEQNFNKSNVLKQQMAKDLTENPSPAYRNKYIDALSKKGYSKDALIDFALSLDKKPMTDEEFQAQSENQPETILEKTGLNKLGFGGKYDPLTPLADWGEDFSKKSGEHMVHGLERAKGGAEELRGEFSDDAGSFTGKVHGIGEIGLGLAEPLFQLIPQAAVFNASVDAINTAAKKNLSEDQAKVIEEATALPFSIMSKTIDALGLEVEEGSVSGQLAELWDIVAGGKFIHAIPGGKGEKGISEAIEDLKDISKKAAEGDKVAQQKIKERTDYLKSLKLEDIKKAAEEKGTPESKELAAKIDEKLNDAKEQEASEANQLHNKLAELQAETQKPEFVNMPKEYQDAVLGDIEKADQSIKDVEGNELVNTSIEAHREGEIADINSKVETLRASLEGKPPAVQESINNTIAELETRRKEIAPPAQEIAKESQAANLEEKVLAEDATAEDIKQLDKLKTEEDAILKKKALSLQEKENVKSGANENIISEGTQDVSGINSKKKRNYTEEDISRRVEASSEWLQAIERGDMEAVRNSAKKLFREQDNKEGQEYGLLDDTNRGWVEVRAQGNNGENIGEKTSEIGTRSSFESERTGQQRGESSAIERTRSSEGTSKGNNIGEQKSQLTESEKLDLVEKTRELSKMPSGDKSSGISRDLQKMLSESVSNKEKTNEIIDLITKTLKEHGPFSERISEKIHEREQSPIREEGRGRESLEPRIEGAKAAEKIQGESAHKAEGEILTPEPPRKPPVNDGKTPQESPRHRAKSLATELSQAERLPKELREKIEEDGLKGEVFSHEEAMKVTEEIAKEYGIEEAVDMANRNILKGSVKAFVYGKAIDYYAKKIEESKTKEERDEWAELGAEVAEMFESNSEDAGRYISAIGYYYKNHPDIIAKRSARKIASANEKIIKDSPSTNAKIESIQKELESLKKEFEGQVEKGVNEEFNKIAEKLFTKETIKKVDEVADDIIAKIKSGTFASLIPPPILIGAINTVRFGLKRGMGLANSVQVAIKDIKDWIEKTGYKGEFNEKELTEKLTKTFEKELPKDVVGKKNKKVKKITAKAKIKAAKLSENKKINEFGKLLSERLPLEAKEKLSKEEKLKKLAAELDETLSTDEWSELLDDYTEIKNEEAKKQEGDKNVKEFGKLLSEKIPTEKENKIVKEDKLKELSQKLDSQYDTTEYSEAVNEYLGIKENEKTKQENDKKLIKFGKLLSKAIPVKGETVLEAETRKNKELKQLGEDLDKANNTTEYSEAVNEYLGMKDAEKVQKEINDFGKLFSEKTKTKKSKTDRIQKLKDKAADLDRKLGGNQYSELVKKYGDFKSEEAKNNAQQAILNKYFPKKRTESESKRKELHEKIIDQYNAGVFKGGVNKEGHTFESLFYEKLGMVNPNSAEVQAKLAGFAEQINKAPENSNLHRRATEDMLDYLANQAYESKIKSGSSKLSAMWYANILSSPATHLRNLQYNAIQSLISNPLLMAEKAALKGNFKDIVPIYKDLFRGLAKGVTESKDVLKTGRGSRFDAIAARSITERGSKFMRFFRWPSRGLKSSDILTTAGGYESKMGEFAREIVRKEHPDWSTEKVNTKANEFLSNTQERLAEARKTAEADLEKFYGPEWRNEKDIKTIQKIREFELMEESMPEEMKAKKDEAISYAKRSFLTSKPTGIYGDASELINNMNNKFLGATRYVMPFVNVPLNLAQSIIDKSPVGLLKAWRGKEGSGESATELTKDQRQEIALKAINYSTAIASLAAINGDDKNDSFVITGQNTGNYTDNKGRTRGGDMDPYSVYVNGVKVFSYKSSPWAAALMPVGYMRDYKLYGDNKSTSDEIANVAVNYLLYTKELSSMKGLAGMFESMEGIQDVSAEGVGEAMANLAQGFIPYSSALKFSTNTANAYMGKDDKRPINWQEYFFRDIPFLQGALRTRKDHFGQPVREGSDIPLVPISIDEKSPYYKLTSEHNYDPHYVKDDTFMIDGEQKTVSQKDMDDINVRRGEIVKESLDSKNVFISKDASDKGSKDSNITTMQYLEGLDNDEFKTLMDKLFLEAYGQAKLEKFGEKEGISAKELKVFKEKIDKMKKDGRDVSKKQISEVKKNIEKGKEFKKKGLQIEIKSY